MSHITCYIYMHFSKVNIPQSNRKITPERLNTNLVTSVTTIFNCSTQILDQFGN